MKSQLLVLVTLLFAITLKGQNPTQIESEKPNIEVTGTAEKEIIPDEIYIAITLKERQVGKDKVSIEKQETDLKAALVSLNIPLENLSLSDANANYIKVKWTKKDVITKNEFLLKVKDALTVGKVFEKLDELKIEDAYISRVSHSQLEEFKKEVRIMAISAAKDKADYLLAAIGETTGKALLVYEQSPNYRIEEAMVNTRGSRSESSILYLEEDKLLSSNQVIQFQKIKLQASIYVRFEIQ